MRRVLAWVFWVGGFGVLVYGAIVSDVGPWSWTMMFFGGFTFGAVGLVLALRTPFAMGWLFLLVQATLASELAGFPVGNWMVLLIAAILLTFPTGSLPSPRWRWAVWALAFVTLIGGYEQVLGDIDSSAFVWIAFQLLVLPVTIASAVRIFIDYVRAEGEVRQQLKWLAWVLVVGGAILLISMIPLPYIDDAHDLAGVVLFIGSPIAVGLAVTRYRLYEVDRIISRTVAYTLIVVVLALVYAGLVAAVSTQFDTSFSVAAATLAVAALFTPVRRRVQASVDRRFNRAKYDHERVVAEFSSTLRDQIDGADLVNGWMGVVSETMRPTAVGVWIKQTM